MQHSLKISLFIIAVFFLSPNAFASNIGIVDIQHVVRESKAFKHIDSQLDSRSKKYMDIISKQETEIRDADKNLLKKKTILSKEAFEAEVGKFRKQVIDVQKDVQMKKSVLDNAYAEAMSELRQSVFKIVSEIARQKSLDVIIPKSHTLYNLNSLDISKEVLTILNKRVPKITINLKKHEKK